MVKDSKNNHQGSVKRNIYIEKSHKSQTQNNLGKNNERIQRSKAFGCQRILF